eukprot:jgi/Mesvir1/24809/Mv22058-RA.2
MNTKALALAEEKAAADIQDLQVAKGVTLAWKWLTLDVRGKSGKIKRILHPSSGMFAAASLTGILGPSGAGKSSFLNVCAGKKVKGKVGGSVTLNGEPVEAMVRLGEMAYVKQEDILLGALTVRETLLFAAFLLLPRKMSSDAKIRRVDAVIQELLLVRCKDTLVGNHVLRGVSGGEKRRLSVALELITKPSVVLLDEPTSGLDTSSALVMVRAFKALVGHGHTIIATVHQPRQAIFDLFDTLVLLAHGHLVYLGPLRDAEHYFASLGFRIPANVNTADGILDILAEGWKRKEEEAAAVATATSTRALALSSSSEGNNAVGRASSSTGGGASSARAVAGASGRLLLPDIGAKGWVTGESGTADVAGVDLGSISLHERKKEFAESLARSFRRQLTASASMVARDRDGLSSLPEGAGSEVYHPSETGHGNDHERAAGVQSMDRSLGGGGGLVNANDKGNGGRMAVAAGGISGRKSLKGKPLSSSLSKLGEGASGWQQYVILVKRFARTARRNPTEYMSLIFEAIIMNALFALLFSEMEGGDGDRRVISRVFYYMFASLSSVGSCVEAIPTFMEFRLVFDEERGRRMYGLLPYVLAFLTVSTIPYAIMPLAGLCVSYWAVDVAHAPGHFFYLWFTISISVQIFMGFTMTMSFISRHNSVVVGSANLIVVTGIMFCGILVNYKQLPSYLRWIYWLNPLQYTVNGMLINEFGKHDANANDLFDLNRYSSRWEALGYLAILLAGYQVPLTLFAMSRVDKPSMLSTATKHIKRRLRHWGCLKAAPQGPDGSKVDDDDEDKYGGVASVEGSVWEKDLSVGGSESVSLANVTKRPLPPGGAIWGHGLAVPASEGGNAGVSASGMGAVGSSNDSAGALPLGAAGADHPSSAPPTGSAGQDGSGNKGVDGQGDGDSEAVVAGTAATGQALNSESAGSASGGANAGAVALTLGGSPHGDKCDGLLLPLDKQATLTWTDVSYYVVVKVAKGDKKKGKKEVDKAQGAGEGGGAGAAKAQKKLARTKCVLQPTSGAFHPGTLTAVMGPSGAGKTTLLNALGGRIVTGDLYGSVRLNGTLPIAVAARRGLMAYVKQEDYLVGSLTVRETLLCAALLRLPGEMARAEKDARVAQVLRLLLLEGAEHTLVGNHLLRGISGGEKRRLSVALEVVTQPPLVLLDEPTTGLDAYAALELVKALHGMCARGHTIAATMHQPRHDIFHLLDGLVLLARGHVVYNGRAADVAAHFHAVGLTCPPHVNVADFLLDVLSEHQGEGKRYRRQSGALGRVASAPDAPAAKDSGAVSVGPVAGGAAGATASSGDAANGDGLDASNTVPKDDGMLVDGTNPEDPEGQDSSGFDEVLAALQIAYARKQAEEADAQGGALAPRPAGMLPGGSIQGASAGGSQRAVGDLSAGRRYPISRTRATGVLTWRFVVSIWRDPVEFRFLVFQAVLFGVTYALIFSNVDIVSEDLEQDEARNREILARGSYLLWALLLLAYIPINTLDSLRRWMVIFREERERGAYSTVSFVVAQSLISFVQMGTLVFLFLVISYFSAGLRASAFPFVWLVFTVGMFTMSAAIFSLSAIPINEAAMGISNLILIGNCLFSGYILTEVGALVQLSGAGHAALDAYHGGGLILLLWAQHTLAPNGLLCGRTLTEVGWRRGSF